MGHLTDYENAQGELNKALAALDVVAAKNSKNLAWQWANIAADHATKAGIKNADKLLGNGRYPETDTLRQALTNNTLHIGQTIANVVGQVVFNHFAVPVQPGRLITAVALFTKQFGWVEHIERAVQGDWGKARFVSPTPDTIAIQLTEPAKQDVSDVLSTVHLALKVGDPMFVAKEIQNWAYRGGLKNVTIEDIGGGKVFLTLADIFAVDIELVP